MEEETLAKGKKVDTSILEGDAYHAAQAGLITEEGLRVMGMGLLIKKLDYICGRQEKIEQHLFKVQNDIQKLAGYKKEQKQY